MHTSSTLWYGKSLERRCQTPPCFKNQHLFSKTIWSKTRGRAIKTPFSCYRKIHYKKSRFRVCQRMAASISVTWDELHRSYFDEEKRKKHQKCEERKTALVLETGLCLPTTCFPFLCRTIVLNTKRKKRKKENKKQRYLLVDSPGCGFYRDVSDLRLFQ